MRRAKDKCHNMGKVYKRKLLFAQMYLLILSVSRMQTFFFLNQQSKMNKQEEEETKHEVKRKILECTNYVRETSRKMAIVVWTCKMEF